MAFHRRCTYFFLDLFSIFTLICLAIEILGPWMLNESDKCNGIVFECEACPTPQTLSRTKCQLSSKLQALDSEKEYFISLVTASIAGSIVTIMTVFVIILSCGSCRDSSSCSRAMSRFALAYILLDVLALIANIVAMAMWSQMKGNSQPAPSFWMGWTANGLLLILLVILIILRKCGDEDEGFGDHKSQVSADQPLFRSLYQVTPTTVFHNRS